MVGTRRVVTLAVVAALALAGCGDDDGGDGAASTTTGAGSVDATTSTTAAAGGSTETTASGTDEGTSTTAGDPGDPTTTTSPDSEGRDTETSVLDSLDDGEHYGYLAGLEEGTVEGQDVQVVIWDEVEFLTGEAADEAAALAGDESPVPNDYYVRNTTQTVRRLAVVPDASAFTLDGGGPDLVPSSVSEVAFEDHLFKILVSNVRGVTTVSLIEAVYLP